MTLCNVLQVPTQPSGIQSQSDRITQVVAAALAGAAAAKEGQVRQQYQLRQEYKGHILH